MQNTLPSGNCFTFGKYKGQSILATCFTDPKYCLWADENVGFFSLSEEQRKIAKNKAKEKEEAYWEWVEETYGMGYSFD